MPPRHRSETALAWLTLFSVAVHFTLETWYHLVWGQPLTALLVDYIASALMLLAVWISLKARPGSAAGLLAAAWGFTFCLAWLAGFGRLEVAQQGGAPVNDEAEFVMPVLVFSVGLVGVIFLWSLLLAWRQSRNAG
jgi:hypothetical protein